MKKHMPIAWLISVICYICVVAVLAISMLNTPLEKQAANESSPVETAVKMYTKQVEEQNEENKEEKFIVYFNVPLDRELQNHIFEVCDGYGVDRAIVVAMIQRESQFDPEVIGDNGESFGLMQVQPKWHHERMAELGCTDLLDPYQNVIVGIDYFAELMELDRGVTWALMAYNGGYAYANRNKKAGITSDYAASTLANSKQFEKVFVSVES